MPIFEFLKQNRHLKNWRKNMVNIQDLLSRITINPKVMVNKPTIRGMRVTVEQLLRALSDGVSEKELLLEYPELEKDDFQAVYAYATGLVEEEQVFPLRVAG
jgi:uncharacterized protein (DUF433 family)